MTDDEALLRSVFKAPDNDGPRLAYADWLEEHGENERAELIRVQIELCRCPEDDPRHDALEARAEALTKAHASAWLRPLREALDRPRCSQLGRGWKFHRGFLAELDIEARRLDFLTAAKDFLAREPVEELGMSCRDEISLDRAVEEVAAAHCLRCLRSLQLWGGGELTAQALHRLGTSRYPPRLTELSLSLTVPAATLAGLVGTPLARRLRSLSFHVAPGDTPNLLKLLTEPSFLPALTLLGWYDGPLGEKGLRRLARGPHLPALTGLHLWCADVGPGALAILLGSPLWGRLTDLSLDHSALDESTVKRLAAALPGSQLRKLRLAYAGLTHASTAALGSALSWGELEELSLDGNPLGDAGVIDLARTPHLAGLRYLDLYSCEVGDTGARELAASPHAAGLRHVQLYEPDLSLGARRALRKRFGKAFRFGH
ncbi:MAG: TIGR02996 domain-containing protein [Gemmataceae bacterium]|nr:TIGR02996 domain-containing protein [Gemmataceae bacterium]